jgi:hypothetical protein
MSDADADPLVYEGHDLDSGSTIRVVWRIEEPENVLVFVLGSGDPARWSAPVECHRVEGR